MTKVLRRSCLVRLKVNRPQITGLRFTHELMDPSLAFLDLEIFKDSQNLLAFRVFQKSMNRYLYLTPDSCHPRHTIDGYIKGELIRFKRNSFFKQDFDETRARFMQRLLDRGFTLHELLKVFTTITWDSYPTTPKETQNPPYEIALVLPYTRRKVNIAGPLQDLLNSDCLSNEAKATAKKYKIIFAKSTTDNVGKICCSSAITPNEESFLANQRPSATVNSQYIPPSHPRPNGSG